MVPTALRPQGIRSRPRVILQEAGAVVETGCYSRLQITSGECLGVNRSCGPSCIPPSGGLFLPWRCPTPSSAGTGKFVKEVKLSSCCSERGAADAQKGWFRLHQYFVSAPVQAAADTVNGLPEQYEHATTPQDLKLWRLTHKQPRKAAALEGFNV